MITSASRAHFFTRPRSAGMHILVKGGDSSLREVVNDARALFDSNQRHGIHSTHGFDISRLWLWTLEETSDTFAGYPVRVARLIETDRKDQSKHELSWVITTDFLLTPAELREVAHVRWSIENNVAGKLSGLVKTKQVRFKEQRPYLTLLSLICGALAAYDLALLMMKDTHADDKEVFGAVKWTYGMRYQYLFLSLEEACFS